MSTALAKMGSSSTEHQSFDKDSEMEHMHLQHSENPREFFEAAALLAIFSALTINEGVTRFISSNPSSLSSAQDALPVVVPLLGALFEIIIGIFGLFVGLAALICNSFHLRIAKLYMLVQVVLGFHVILVYTLAVPYFRAKGLTNPLTPSLSLAENRLLIAFGGLTSLSFCSALQGGQFLFVSRMVHCIALREYNQRTTGTRKLAMFWNANLSLAGLWTLLTGLVIISRQRGFLLSATYGAPPNIGRLPHITTATGGLMLAWGLLGTAISAKEHRQLIGIYTSASCVVYVLVLLNYSVLQLGLVPNASAGAASVYAGLVFALTFLGPFYMHRQAEELNGGLDEDAKV